MLHSSGKPHATCNLTEMEARFADLFGVTTTALSDFFFFGIFDLKSDSYF